MKKFKKEFIEKITQRLADFIVVRLEKSNSDNEFNFWIDMGLSLDSYCIDKEIYLN